MSRQIIIVAATAVALSAGPAAAEKGVTTKTGKKARGGGVHVVAQGDTLWEISRSYGCDLGALKRRNKLRGNHLRIGQRIRLPRGCSRGGAKATTRAKEPTRRARSKNIRRRRRGGRRHVVKPGDTLFAIARKYDCTVAELRRRNKIRGNLIRPGQKLAIDRRARRRVRLRLDVGQSIGRPQAGRLAHATQLLPGEGYHLRRPERTYGTEPAVDHIKRAIAAVQRHYPSLHELAIGDLSAETGGPISMHASHQSGRDADLGFYFVERPANYPASFVVASEDKLHFEASWKLLSSLADTRSEPEGVQRIFMTYSTQKLFYELARSRGVPRARLDELFQYPRGIGAPGGIIRHEPGHDEHIHVRFKCPPSDKTCS